jgi:catechol 2,3-dioxygenase-like lactoylglutathione lyase family enzyme
MFKDSKAFSSFSVKDVDEAKKFYTEVLGVEVAEEYGGLTLKLGSGAQVMVYPKGDDHHAAAFTVLNFPVKDVEEAVEELGGKGVKFEQYDFMHTDERGITPKDSDQGPRMAWFKDPSGNIISLMELPEK